MPATAALRAARRLSLVVLGAALMAFNINTFVRAGGLIPGGFTGVALLSQEILLRFAGLAVPFSPLLFALNAAPAIVCFRAVGRNFTAYSVLMVVLSGLMTDLMPVAVSGAVAVGDPLLSAVFGGMLNAAAVAMCLFAGATSGGTDFIAIFVSERHKRDAWGYIFAANCVILVAAGAIFSLEKALYSIIFQFTTTMALGWLYRAYQQHTMLIVTGRADEVYELIRERTNHAATAITGTGLYGREERTLLYSVVHSNEVAPLIRAIRLADPGAFINVIKTEQVNGRFFRKPKD